MGFSDLHFGWREEGFELSDVEIINKLKLKQSDKESDDFNFTTSTPGRYLRAKASLPDDMYDDMFLGVPKDKKRKSRSSESIERLDHIQLRISELDDEAVSDLKDLPEYYQLGQVGYLEPGEFGGDYVYAEFYVPKDAFDEIERITSAPGTKVNVTLALECWYWLGPIGDSQIYINKDRGKDDKDANAELVEVKAIKVFPNQPKVDEDVVAEDEDPKPTIDDLNQHLLVMQKHTTSIKAATWLTAFAVLSMAVVMIL